jgi:hypothetical protein
VFALEASEAVAEPFVRMLGEGRIVSSTSGEEREAKGGTLERGGELTRCTLSGIQGHGRALRGSHI